MLRVSMSFIGFTAVVFPLFGAVFAANTNRWDPILNYPGSKEVVSCHHQYLKHYWSDFYDFGIILI